MKTKTWCALVALALVGCGGSTSNGVSGPDATTDTTSGDDTGGGDTTTDSSAGDAGVDAPLDSGGGDVILPDGACGCTPFWCGCGQCDPNTIACTVNPPGCPLGCVSGCPELQQVTCACQSGRCIRGGIDAGGIGCLQDEDCPPGDCCAHTGKIGPGNAGQCKPNGDMCCGGGCP